MPDVQITDQGSIVQFLPLSQEAKDWFDENVHSEGWQWFANRLCVDHRCAENLTAGLIEAGFEVE